MYLIIGTRAKLIDKNAHDEICQEDFLLSETLLRRQGINAFSSSLLLAVCGEYEDILFVRLSS